MIRAETQTPMPEAPETYPRRVLLAVTGLSPQIVTEICAHAASLQRLLLVELRKKDICYRFRRIADRVEYSR